MKLPFNQTHFLTSAALMSQMPADIGKEVAFAGRSNAGKSSAINTITGINGLAKISKTPGRTQLINFFQLLENTFLVDLPGYGYAKVPESVKERWLKTLSHYFEKRASLKGLILVMDIRHPLKPFDRQMLDWAIEAGLPAHMLLTKSDKLSQSQAKQILLSVKKELPHEEAYTAQLFSSLKRQGVEEVRHKITELLF